MTDSIAERLAQGVVLLDGGMGSQLIARGLESGTSPELWNVERPDDVRAVHESYIAAGSDVVQTNTFGGNPFVLEKHCLDQMMKTISLAAARVARDAAGEKNLVAGDIGPSGLLLPPVGTADAKALEEGFGLQAAALAEGGVDYIAIETMMDLNEALCAIRGAQSTTDLPVTVCMTFDRKKRGFFTMMGNSPEECALALVGEGAVAVGANCSVGSDVMLELCQILVSATDHPIIVKPNAGQPALEEGRPTYRQPPEDFANDVMAMVRSGAKAIGGCCGTDDRFITVLRKKLTELKAT